MRYVDGVQRFSSMNNEGDSGSWLARFALAGYLAALVYFVIERSAELAPFDFSLVDFQNSRRLAGVLARMLGEGLAEAGRYVPLGFLLPLSLARPPARLARAFRNTIPSLALGAGLVFGIIGLRWGSPWRLPAPTELVFPAMGCLTGVWLGASWLRGFWARLFVLPKLAAAAVLALAGLAAALYLATENEALQFVPARVESSEKRALVELFRNPGSTGGARRERTLELTQRHVDTLLAWAFSLGGPEKKGKIRLEEGSATVQASLGVPLGGDRRRYLNLILTARSAVDRGTLRFRMERFVLGGFEAPPILLATLSPLVEKTVSRDPRLGPVLGAVDHVRIDPGALTIRYARGKMPPELLPYLVIETRTAPEVLEATRDQIAFLTSLVPGLPAGDRRLASCLEAAFRLARDRSREGGAVEQNKAAVFALGILMGHPRLRYFVGPFGDSRSIWRAYRALRPATLRGRKDWAQHFLVSAGLSVSSTETLSDAAGLLKEELDAGEGGSGFSFSDLLADRAGTTFGAVATRDEASARKVQERISAGFVVDDFFPEAADLPEELTDLDLKSQYGGVGGPRYRLLTEDIERRIAACATYR
jgi:hypothetical protein